MKRGTSQILAKRGKSVLLFEKMDAIAKVVVRRFGALGIAPQGQEVESASPSYSGLHND
jgi:hypothetical protein